MLRFCSTTDSNEEREVVVRGRGRARGRGRGGVRRADTVDGGDDALWSFVDAVNQPATAELPAEPAHVPPFTVRQTGPKEIPPGTQEPVDFFQLFWSSDLLTTIVRETNR